MTKKLSIEEVRVRFKLASYELLSDYSGTQSPVEYRCPVGHSGKMLANLFFKGRRCPHCSTTARKSNSFIKDSISSDGYLWVSGSYKNAHSPLVLQCPKGHIWTTKWANWNSGYRCAICSFENMSIACSGQNHWRWKEDRESVQEYELARNLQGTWKRAVRQRDKVCQFCGSSDKLHVHHILPFISSLEKRTDLSNGIVLCEKHHIGKNTGVHSILKDNYSFDDWVEFMSNKTYSLKNMASGRAT